MSGLTKSDKCSWIIKASADAPGFKFGTTTTFDGTEVDVHYVEYSSTSALVASDNDPLVKEYIDGTNSANLPKGNYYD